MGRKMNGICGAKMRVERLRLSKSPIVPLLACLLVAGIGLSSTPALAQYKGLDGKNYSESDGVLCKLPGQVRKLGRRVTFVTRPRLIETRAINCKLQGGEIVSGATVSGAGP